MMLAGGAVWAANLGYGTRADLERIEDRGCAPSAVPDAVSAVAKKRQRDEMGSLGSGNHYLEVQAVERILDPDRADAFGLRPGQVVVAIHCGSRGLGHQVATDYVAEMNAKARAHGLSLPDKELACAPIASDLGQRYLGAMAAAMNCALANRQIITGLVREVFAQLFSPGQDLPLLYDVCHNTCREEIHPVGKNRKRLYVHRKGATRALPPGDSDLPPDLRDAGQPVLVGGSMGTASYILAGAAGNEDRSLSSACHGAGRIMSRGQAKKRFKGRDVKAGLRAQGIVVRSASNAGAAEEAPGAYKDIDRVVDVTTAAGLAVPVARLTPLACVKG
jgi:tRNA-splicing ligase RtcB